MYIPAHFAASADDVHDLLTSPAAADLVTATASGLLASTLPMIFDPTVGEHGVLRGHLARNNPSGRPRCWARRWSSCAAPTRTSARAGTRPGPARPGRPDLELRRRPRLRPAGGPRQPGLAGGARRRLTATHESAEPQPWSVDDAPERFVAGQLRAIVGLELTITRVEARLKLSQNRAADDIDGVVAGLQARGDHRSADAVQAARRDQNG